MILCGFIMVYHHRNLLSGPPCHSQVPAAPSSSRTLRQREAARRTKSQDHRLHMEFVVNLRGPGSKKLRPWGPHTTGHDWSYLGHPILVSDVDPFRCFVRLFELALGQKCISFPRCPAMAFEPQAPHWLHKKRIHNKLPVDSQPCLTCFQTRPKDFGQF